MKKMIMTDEHWLLIIVFPISSLAGLSELLRSDEKLITKRKIFSALMNSGLFGVAVAAIMINYVGMTFWPLIVAVSLLSGLGGNASLDLGLSLFKRFAKNKAESHLQIGENNGQTENQSDDNVDSGITNPHGRGR